MSLKKLALCDKVQCLGSPGCWGVHYRYLALKLDSVVNLEKKDMSLQPRYCLAYLTRWHF